MCEIFEKAFWYKDHLVHSETEFRFYVPLTTK